MSFIPQNKSKELSKIPDSRLITNGLYYISPKIDGFYTQIHYDGREVKFFTSNGKPFYIQWVANKIKESRLDPFIIECEYVYGCDGKLGDRTKSAKLTTYRTEFAKGIKSKGNPKKDKFYILDALHMKEAPYYNRYEEICFIEEALDDENLAVILSHVITFDKKDQYFAEWVSLGYEGAMMKYANHIYKPGKRTNDIIKLKKRQTADLLCVGVEPGEGKYEGLLGSLLLVDSKGRYVNVGTGFSDYQRSLPETHYLNKVIEINYEQLLDTYIQPSFICVREDKDANQID